MQKINAKISINDRVKIKTIEDLIPYNLDINNELLLF
jgi:hypothetical protein